MQQINKEISQLSLVSGNQIICQGILQYKIEKMFLLGFRPQILIWALGCLKQNQPEIQSSPKSSEGTTSPSILFLMDGFSLWRGFLSIFQEAQCVGSPCVVLYRICDSPIYITCTL